MPGQDVGVEHALRLDASPERVWSLLGSPAAWSARPGLFAFEISDSPPQTGRLMCVLGTVGAVTSSWVYDSCFDEPAQVSTWRLLTRAPGTEYVFTLSLRVAKRGVTACATARVTDERQPRAPLSRYLRNELRSWLDHLWLIIEGRLPWPAEEIPLTVAGACAVHPQTASASTSAASTIIAASPAQVWHAVCAPELNHILDPAIIAAGRVPGTPEQAVGEMQYTISDLRDGRLAATVHIVRELTLHQRLVYSHVGPPHDQMEMLFAPEQGGTRLELIGTPAAAASEPTRSDGHRRQERLRAYVEGYKELVESSAPS